MIILEQWAGHCLNTKSDKVWAACLTVDHQVISVNGRRGSALRTTSNQFADAAEAKTYYDAKVAEKSQRNGYAPVKFDDPDIGIPSFGIPSQTTTTINPIAPTYMVSHITPSTLEEVTQAMSRPGYAGITEKINGERTLLAYDGTTLTAYNRRGKPISTIPETARVLEKLGRQFVIDGERFAISSTQSGGYAAFDLLELEGQDWRSRPFDQRIAELEHVLQVSSIITNSIAAFGWNNNEDGSRLVLLAPTTNVELITWLRDNAREGVILRTFDAPYEAGDTTHVKKLKFRADVDAIITGITPGLNGGSANLGLIRPRDGKLISIGSVRSGLSAADMQVIADLLAVGQRPVLRVGYLPVRTVATKLAEPTAHLDDLRTDKLAEECTTDQMPANAAAFNAA